MAHRLVWFGAVAAGCWLLATACGDDAECIEVNLTCDLLYEPTFDNVFAQTLAMKCGVAGPCHNAQAAKAGLVYEDPDEAYDLLQSRIEPGVPGCSTLMRRLESTGSEVMPPGNMLSEQERCSIRQWIASGALR